MREILVVQAAATLAMVGLIWFVQVVHYPLLAQVGRDVFARYESSHMTRTTWVVAPLMLVEATLAAALALRPPVGVPPVVTWAALGLVPVIWLSTAFFQVPMHRRLAAGFDEKAYRRLVSSNWIRTAAWSARGLLVLGWML